MKKLFLSLLGIALLSVGTLQVFAADATDKATLAGNALAQLLNEKDQAYVQKFYNFLDGLMAKFIDTEDSVRVDTLTTIKRVLLSKVFYAPAEGYITACYDTTQKITACTMEYAPVCGTDVHTYGNACSLNAANVDKLHDGECKAADKPTVCTMEYAPVCGTDGKTYGNMCNLKASDAAFLINGTCEANISKLSCTHTAKAAAGVCTKEYVPVCGADNITYSNACLATAAGIQYTKGACPVGVCTREYAPVCGIDGKNYSNDCMANAAGVEMDYEGVCK